MKALLRNSLCTIPAAREPGLPARRPRPGLCTAVTSGREEGRFQLHLVGTPLPSARVGKGRTAGHWLAVCRADTSSLDLSPAAVQQSTQSTVRTLPTVHRAALPPSAHVHRQLPGMSVSFAAYAGDCSALVPTPPSATPSMSCHSSVTGTQGCGWLCLTEHRATLL